MKGTIKKVTDKGFGFITAEGLGKDLFFHSNALVGVAFDDLREGDAVSFEILIVFNLSYLSFKKICTIWILRCHFFKLWIGIFFT